MIDRRTFLKSIATVCGAAVVCPGELLKSPVDPWIRAAALRKKNTALGAKCKWRDYHVAAHFKSKTEYEEFLKKFRTAFKNTKFKPPLIIGAHDEKIQTTHRPNQICSQACDPPD